MKAPTIQSINNKTLSDYKSKIFNFSKMKKDIVNKLKRNIELRKVENIKKDLSI